VGGTRKKSGILGALLDLAAVFPGPEQARNPAIMQSPPADAEDMEMGTADHKDPLPRSMCVNPTHVRDCLNIPLRFQIAIWLHSVFLIFGGICVLRSIVFLRGATQGL
jgi:hypothetical protein